MSVNKGPDQRLPITIGAASEIGHREENQDYMAGFSSPFGNVYLIADGMGGHRGGAVASRLAADAFTRHLLAVPASSSAEEALTTAVKLANAEVTDRGNSGDPSLQGMGSTIVVALIRPEIGGLVLTTAHVGDSRAYLYRDGHLEQLTKDHTQVQWMIDSHTLDETAARNHPSASVLTRALGHASDLDVDVSHPLPVRAGDRILLCSDGLSGFTGSVQIENTMRDHPGPSDCAEALVRVALEAESNDNITVQLLNIEPEAEPSPRTSRKTQPEGIAMVVAPVREPAPPPSNPPSRPPSAAWKRGAAFAAAVVLLAAAATWLALHRRPAPGDPLLVALRGRIQAFHAGTTALHTQAVHALAAAKRSEAILPAPQSLAAHPPESRRENDVKGKFAQLFKQYDAVLEESDKLEQDRKNLEQELDALNQSQTPAEDPSTRHARILQFEQHMMKEESELKEWRQQLANANATRNELEAGPLAKTDSRNSGPQAYGKVRATQLTLPLL